LCGGLSFLSLFSPLLPQSGSPVTRSLALLELSHPSRCTFSVSPP
jgi:hypothetical protein